jgi:8-amino-3,8-dideoxy-alpha-D-manno-octulosonate transaminase
LLKAEGCGAINFGENTWHFYPKWEHLLAGSTPTRSGWPFATHGGKRRVVFDPQSLPKSAEMIGRTLVFPVSVKMPEERIRIICAALKKAQHI